MNVLKYQIVYDTIPTLIFFLIVTMDTKYKIINVKKILVNIISPIAYSIIMIVPFVPNVLLAMDYTIAFASFGGKIVWNDLYNES